LEHAGDRVASERGAHEREGGIEDDAGDERETGAEPEQRLPPARAPRDGPVEPPQRAAAATALRWSWSSTCLGLPPGCTARPMFCWTSSLTRSHAGSVVGASRALGSASR